MTCAYESTIKLSNVLIYTIAWMNLKNIVLKDGARHKCMLSVQLHVSELTQLTFYDRNEQW